MSKKLIIMRHASWERIADKHPLSEQGQLETIDASKEIMGLLGQHSLDAAYYSSVCRTEQTAKIAAAVFRGIVTPFNDVAKPFDWIAKLSARLSGQNTPSLISGETREHAAKKNVSVHSAEWLNMLAGDFIASIRKLPDDQDVVLLVTHDGTMNSIALEIDSAIGTKAAGKIRRRIERVAPLKASGVVLDIGADIWQDFARSDMTYTGDFVCGGMSRYFDVDPELRLQIDEALAL